MPLDIKAELRNIRSMYSDNINTTLFHALIVGEKGVGKTSLAKTCPAPVLIHSFDPGGTTHLREEIAAGKIIVDNRFENDELRKPTAYLAWEAEYNRLGQAGVFSSIGTYIIDSLTTMAHSILWQIMKKENRLPATMQACTDDKKQGMRVQDWGTVLNTFLTISRSLCNLPCHTIMLGHIARDRDEVTQAFVNSVALQGQARDQVPIVVPEFYTLRNIYNPSTGTSQRFLYTQDADGYKGSTRMGAGIFLPKEEADIRKLLQKANMSYQDKDLLL